MKKKRHTPEEIAAKLRDADEMLRQGRLHSEVARTLGVSVMTYHRWRKARAAEAGAPADTTAAVTSTQDDEAALIAALQIENVRLRRLLADLVLERVALEEALESRTSPSARPRRTAK